ncbi:MAG TPA: beta-L-arabinofuranosidase domain-containing protein, partial [Chthonomonadaceae bacterium]|nr:beta-L-arabinofuranosidase domain-containing protein [Chthonomonadaceae bacterium]
MPDSPPSERAAGPVVDMSNSPYAVLRPVPLSAVQLQDAFWEPRRVINREVTLPTQLRQCEETGRIDNFRRASGKKRIDFQGIFFNDSDVYKWVEAASFSLATHPDPKLEADLDAVIAEIAAAQQPDGYLNTYFMFEREAERFTNLKDMHEIYCAGHLMQAAVAHHRATGKTTLLDVATRLADHLDRVFGPEPGKRPGACGHEEAEMALVELYRETGNDRYLKLAKFMIESRGQKPPILGGSPYHQDHLPFAQQTEMTGHAVRQLYLCCGAADVAAETGEDGYRQALDALWRNFTEKRMYVTGGAGSRWEGEAFGEDYELPNDRAYT